MERPRDSLRTAMITAELLSCHRFHFGNEKALQDGIERVLASACSATAEFVREFDLSPNGRIDFYNPAERVGLEVKVKGSPSAVIEQLLGYAGNPAIEALVLVTSKIKLAALPPTMNGKPLISVPLWANGF